MGRGRKGEGDPWRRSRQTKIQVLVIRDGTAVESVEFVGKQAETQAADFCRDNYSGKKVRKSGSLRNILWRIFNGE